MQARSQKAGRDEKLHAVLFAVENVEQQRRLRFIGTTDERTTDERSEEDGSRVEEVCGPCSERFGDRRLVKPAFVYILHSEAQLF